MVFHMNISVGKKVRALRIEKNISLPELAESAGVSKGFLSQLENDEQSNPSLDTLNKVAKVLDVTLAALLEKGSVKSKRVIPEEIDPALKEFIQERHASKQPVDQDILQALYAVQHRKQSKTDWAWLYESIKRGLNQK